MANAVSHDQNFKNLIVDYPVEALALFASREAPAPADDARVTALRQEQLKERLGDRFRALDTPLRVEWTGKRRKETLFVMEEVSDWTGFSAHHLARYCLDLSEMYGTERVVPVAIFLRDAGRARRSLALGTGRQAYLRFGHLVAEIGKMPVERWIGSDNLVARVNLPNMRGARDRKVEVYGEAVRGLLKLEPDPLKRAKYLDFIDIYADLTDNERERYKEQYPEENEVMAGIVQTARDEGLREGIERGIKRGIERGIERGMQRGIERGMQRGIEQGMQQGIERGVRRGRVDGERAVLERLLLRRFGSLSPEVAARLGGASAPELETWAEKVLDADTLDEVFNSGR